MERIKKKDNSLTNLIDNFENELKKKIMYPKPTKRKFDYSSSEKKKKKNSFVKGKKI